MNDAGLIHKTSCELLQNEGRVEHAKLFDLVCQHIIIIVRFSIPKYADGKLGTDVKRRNDIAWGANPRYGMILMRALKGRCEGWSPNPRYRAPSGRILR